MIITGPWMNILWTDDDGVGSRSKMGVGQITFGWMMVLVHDPKWALDKSDGRMNR
jgi:hypothetical protein